MVVVPRMAGSRSAISEVGYEMRFKERVSKWKSEETRFVKRNGSDGKKLEILLWV